MKEKTYRRRGLSAPQVILLGFAAVILIGALLLMLPISTKDRAGAPFEDALFTSTSAVCVTGLVVRDTGSYFSIFGQSVILLLIQIGGIGVVSVAAFFMMLSGKDLSLGNRSLVREATSAPNAGGAISLMLFALKVTLCAEFVGALALLPGFCSLFGARGIYMALFHAVSAFCNAGFDLMGTQSAPFVSFTGVSTNLWILFPIMLLIVFGGIGFLTWRDVIVHRYRIRKYSLQSKVVLLSTAFLILLPALYFFFFEFSHLPMGERLLAALFQSVTPRTAGFNSAPLTAMRGSALAIMILLMLIGGSPGSTAGGMKTTTFSVLIANMLSVFRRGRDVECFERRLPSDVIKQASTVFVLYLSLFFGGALIISAVDGIGIGIALYETASAVGTVGLTLGVTPMLGGVSRCVLMVLMFMGRVGGLTVIYATVANDAGVNSKFPEERITVG